MKLAKLVRKHFPKTNGVKASVHKQWVVTLARLKVAECNAKLMSLQRLQQDLDAEASKPDFVDVASFHHKKVVQEKRRADYGRFLGFLNANASPAIHPSQLGRAFVGCLRLKDGPNESYASINERCNIVVDAWAEYRAHWIEKIRNLDPSANTAALTAITGGIAIAKSKEWKRNITAAEYQRAMGGANQNRAAIRQYHTSKNGFHGSAECYEPWHNLSTASPAHEALKDFHIVTPEDEKEEREKKEKQRRNKDEIDKLMGRETSEEKRQREQRQENERKVKRSAKLSAELLKIIYGNPNPPMGATRLTDAGVVMLGHLNRNGAVRIVEIVMTETFESLMGKSIEEMTKKESEEAFDKLLAMPVKPNIQEFEYGWQVSGADDIRYISGPKFLDWAEEELARVMGVKYYLG